MERKQIKHQREKVKNATISPIRDRIIPVVGRSYETACVRQSLQENYIKRCIENKRSHIGKLIGELPGEYPAIITINKK